MRKLLIVVAISFFISSMAYSFSDNNSAILQSKYNDQKISVVKLSVSEYEALFDSNFVVPEGSVAKYITERLKRYNLNSVQRLLFNSIWEKKNGFLHTDTQMVLWGRLSNIMMLLYYNEEHTLENIAILLYKPDMILKSINKDGTRFIISLGFGDTEDHYLIDMKLEEQELTPLVKNIDGFSKIIFSPNENYLLILDGDATSGVIKKLLVMDSTTKKILFSRYMDSNDKKANLGASFSDDDKQLLVSSIHNEELRFSLYNTNDFSTDLLAGNSKFIFDDVPDERNSRNAVLSRQYAAVSTGFRAVDTQQIEEFILNLATLKTMCDETISIYPVSFFSLANPKIFYTGWEDLEGWYIDENQCIPVWSEHLVRSSQYEYLEKMSEEDENIKAYVGPSIKRFRKVSLDKEMISFIKRLDKAVDFYEAGFEKQAMEQLKVLIIENTKAFQKYFPLQNKKRKIITLSDKLLAFVNATYYTTNPVDSLDSLARYVNFAISHQHIKFATEAIKHMENHKLLFTEPLANQKIALIYAMYLSSIGKKEEAYNSLIEVMPLDTSLHPLIKELSAYNVPLWKDAKKISFLSGIPQEELGKAAWGDTKAGEFVSIYGKLSSKTEKSSEPTSKKSDAIKLLD